GAAGAGSGEPGGSRALLPPGRYEEASRREARGPGAVLASSGGSGRARGASPATAGGRYDPPPYDASPGFVVPRRGEEEGDGGPDVGADAEEGRDRGSRSRVLPRCLSRTRRRTSRTAEVGWG